MKVVLYGENGQYCTQSYETEIETKGTPRALKALARKYEREWATYGDNWVGWLLPYIAIFPGTLAEFNAQYPDWSHPHHITGCQYRIGVIDRLAYNDMAVESDFPGYMMLLRKPI